MIYKMRGGGTPEKGGRDPEKGGYHPLSTGVPAVHILDLKHHNTESIEENTEFKSIDQDLGVTTNLDSNGIENLQKKFPLFPNEKNWDLELPQHSVDLSIQWFFSAQKTEVVAEQILGLWEVFKKKYFTGQKSYQNTGDAYSHFTNWITKQNLKKLSDGTFKTPQKRDRHAGANEVANRLAAKIAASGDSDVES